jgi:cellulose synthase operon protein C
MCSLGRVRIRWVALFLLGAVLTATQETVAQEIKLDPAATRDYAVAAGLQNKQLYAQAVQRWQKFIQTYPNDPRLAHAHNHLGTCQLQDAKYADAVATFRALQTKFPKFESLDATQFNIALALYNIGLDSKKPADLQTAMAAFGEVPAKFAKSKHVPAALYYQAECLYQTGSLAEAAGAYQKVIGTYPDSDLLPDVYYALGTTQQELGKEKEAAVTFNAFLAKYPKDRKAGECRLRLGQSLVKQKLYAEAIKVFEQAAALPDFLDADFALVQQAHCLYEQNQFAQAAALYEALPRKFPKSTHAGLALLSAGKCWYQADKYPQAQAALAAIDPKAPEAPEAAYWLGQALIRLNRSAEALPVLEKALAAYPGNSFLPQLAFARAAALYEQPARRKEAVAAYADFAAKNPQHAQAPRAVYMAALAALKLEDYQTAGRQAEAFLADKKLEKHELVPDVLFIAAESQVQADKPDYARAEALYRRLLAASPNHPHAVQARLRIGLCLYLARKHPEAVAHLTAAVADLKDPALAAEAYFLLGRAHQDAGRAVEAGAAFGQALTAKADWQRGDEVLLALAQTQRARKLYADAVTQLKRLVSAYPKSLFRAQALYDLGEIAYEQGKFDEAAGFYDQAAAQAPKGDLAPQALYGAGLIWVARKDHVQAVAAFTKLLAAHPDSPVSPRARYLRGLANQRLKQFEPAAKDLEAFLAAKPDKDAPDARYALALCQAALKQHDRAAETLTALLKEQPDYAQADQAYYEMAFALLAAKKDKEAAAAFRQLTAKKPDSPLAAESWFRVGEFHENAKEPAEAAQAYAAGLARAKAPELREKLQYKLGVTQFGLERFAEAATVLQAQIKEFPKGELLPDATYLAGECLYRQNKFQEALPLFEQVIQAKSKKYLPRSIYRTGACQAGLKQWAASQTAYTALIEQHPDFDLIQEARYGLGWAVQNQDKLEEARAIYEQVIKAVNTETAAKSRFMIGEIAFRQKKHKEALEHFLETALGYPYPEWQALGYYEAGRCFVELKETKKAIETLETLVKKFPNHPRAKDAANLIVDLKK